jgi:hypothetical protein
MARQRHSDPLALLHRLLDRHESSESGRALSEFVDQAFPTQASEDSFRRTIEAVQAQGSVLLHMDRGDASHLMKKVELLDASSLYVFLSRQPREDRVTAASETLKAGLPASLSSRARSAAEALLGRMEAAWRRGERPHRMGPEDTSLVADFLPAWGVASTKADDDPRDLRTYSRQTLGDSKHIERHMGRILGEVRSDGRTPPDTPDDQIIAALGLEKYPHLVQVAGAIPAISGIAGHGVHIGLHPDTVEGLEVAPIDYLLTVENYTSFCRQVREAWEPRAIILYTGGWPGRGERRAIAHFARHAQRVLHWGDIDMAGLAIADAVWRAAGREIELHCMNEGIARRGARTPIRPMKLDPKSPAAPLAAWLCSESGGYVLEQEDLDPVPISGVETG